MDHALLTGLLLKMFAPNSSCAQGHLAKTRSSTSAIKAGSGKNRSWRLASSTSFQATRGWTAAPALGVILQHWAVRSAVRPVSCPGYKKAELTNEHIAFFFFFLKTSQIFLWEWLAIGRRAGNILTELETCPWARGWGTPPPMTNSGADDISGLG